jgi:hypothetical protein
VTGRLSEVIKKPKDEYSFGWGRGFTDEILLQSGQKRVSTTHAAIFMVAGTGIRN